MIYELSLVSKTGTTAEDLASLQQIVHEVVKQNDGEILIEDDWGRLNLAQPTSNGVRDGHYFFYLFKAGPENNTELARRFGINENVLKSMVIAAGEDKDADKLAKGYKTPYSKKYPGSVTDDDSEEGGDPSKDRRRFSRRKSCWFSARQIRADWKDPATFSWLVNEFGKISPARVSGISRKHQRFAQQAIKRARQVGLISHVSGRIAAD